MLASESINLIHHIGGEPQQFSVRESRLIEILSDFLYYETGSFGPGSAGSPIFNDQWELVGIHRASVPKRNGGNQILSRDGTPWKEGTVTDIMWLQAERHQNTQYTTMA